MRFSGERQGLGARGEALAGAHLERAGYHVIARNQHCGRLGELDIVAVKGDALVFCEVKTRTAGTTAGPPLPLDAVGPGKQRRVRKLAAAWLQSRAEPAAWTTSIRFDAIGVTVDRRGRLLALEHIENAF